MYQYCHRLLPLPIVVLLLLAIMAYNRLHQNATGPLKTPKEIAPTSATGPWKELQPGNLELADQFPEFCLQPQRHPNNIDTKPASSTATVIASPTTLQLQLQHPPSTRILPVAGIWTPPSSPSNSRPGSPIAEAEADVPFERLLQRPLSLASRPRPRCVSYPPQRSGRDQETAARLQRSEKRSSSLGTKVPSRSPAHSKLSSPPKPPPKPAKFSRRPARPAESPEHAQAESQSQASAADVVVDSSSIHGVHDQFLTRMTFSEQQRWITVQEKTFTKWCVSNLSDIIARTSSSTHTLSLSVCSGLTSDGCRLNTKIVTRNLEVKDLVKDLSDGVRWAFFFFLSGFYPRLTGSIR